MHIVYWIHFPEETDISCQGYVGVSGNFDKRLKAHKLGNGNKRVFEAFRSQSNIIIETIFKGNEEDCYNYEKRLRPLPLIGWNKSEGGSRPPSPKGNKIRSGNASKALKGRKITWGDKISEANKGRRISPEAIAKAIATRKANNVQVWNKGIKTGPQSASTIEKRSKAMKGKNGKKVVTPLGTFNNITEAAVSHNIKVQTLHARIKYYKMKGYNYVE